MDYSDLADAQQQQQYQEYQAQIQPHEPQPQDPQPYDPAQSHAYEAYYAHQYDSASASQHQYNVSYYQQYHHPHDYAAYQQHQQPQTDYSTAHAAPPDAFQIHQKPEIGGPSDHGYPQERQDSYQVPPGLNPAAASAVAALSQLSQFAGKMEAEERARTGVRWHNESVGLMGPMGGARHHLHSLPPHHAAVVMHPGVGGRSPYRGGGRRDSGPFRGRGGGRGSFSHQSPRIGGGSSRFRGKGGRQMGRRAGKQFQNATESQSPHGSPKPQTKPTQSLATTSFAGPATPRRPLQLLGWCDICRVDCNTSEILEQHKNGKRHKKTVQRFEQIKAQQKLLAESQALHPIKRSEEAHSPIMLESQVKIDEQQEMVLQVVEEQRAFPDGEENCVSAASESMEDASLMNESKVRIDQLSPPDSGTMTVAQPWKRPRIDGYERRRLPKRKLMGFDRGGRGGKRPSNFEHVHGRPRQLREQPVVCTLCNITCDTKAVFEFHLAGKKHTSQIKRFQGRGVVYGPITVYIPPNQPSVHTPPSIDPLFYGLQTPDMMQQATYIHEGFGVEAYGHHEADKDEKLVLENQNEQHEEQTVQEDREPTRTEPDRNNPLTDQDGVPLENQVSETGGQLAVTSEPEGKDISLDYERKEEVESVEVHAYENAIVEAECSFPSKENDIPAPEYGVLSADGVILPQLVIEVDN